MEPSMDSLEIKESLVPTTRHIIDIIYCGICHLPLEYCMDTPDDNCEKWLLKTHPETHSDLYNKGDDDEEGADTDAKKKGKKIKAAATLKGTVIIKRIERHKRKFVIAVQGLENFDIELKKAAKLFANKFATGSSVTKSPQGNDEIVVQGDVQDEIHELVLKTWKQVPKTSIQLTSK